MRLIPADKQYIKKIKRLYMDAFPRSERKPFRLLIKKHRSGTMDVFALEEDGFCGLAVTAVWEDMVLLYYLAILPEKRGGGAGSKALALLRQKYVGKRLLLEIETTLSQTADMDARLRRKHFYLKNGMREAGFSVRLFGVEMEIISDGAPVTFPEYHSIYENLFGKRVANRFVKEI